MAGAANPAMVQGGGMPIQMGPNAIGRRGGIPNINDGPVGKTVLGGGSIPGEFDATTGMPPSQPMQQPAMPSAAPAAPSRGGMMNPYTQASMAQQGALATYANPAARAQQMMNPYQQSVVDKTLRDVSNAAQLGLSNLDTRARQANAFGGSRHGIAMAEAAKGYQQQALDAVGALNQQGYNQAMNDAFRAASGLQSAGQQSFGYGQAIQQQQMQQGMMQQQMMQNLINAAKQQYAGYAGAPQQGLNTFLGAVYGMPNVSGQQSGYRPGVFDYMMAAGQFA